MFYSKLPSEDPIFLYNFCFVSKLLVVLKKNIVKFSPLKFSDQFYLSIVRLAALIYSYFFFLILDIYRYSWDKKDRG